MKILPCLLLSASLLAPVASASVPTSVEWVDGMSGRMNGKPFRLHNVDAPEAGGVGATVRSAACEQETELGFAARAYMAELTRGKAVAMTANYGVDTRGRQIVDLAVGEMDLASAGLKAGILQPVEDDADSFDWCA